MFSGYGGLVPETWEYSAINPASAAPFGSGCPGNATVPVLAAEQGSRPWLGDTFAARVTNVGSNPFLNVPFVMLGDSRSSWGPLSLPLDLAFVGMIGCTAYTNAVVNQSIPNAGGAARWTLGVPNVTALAGSVVYVQAGVTSPGANPYGVSLSNACELRIGAK